jgi:hypothetical protein
MSEPIIFYDLEAFKEALIAAGVTSVKVYGDYHIINESEQAFLVSYKKFDGIFKFVKAKESK